MLYICYGITKSGSTLAFELTKGILKANGYDQSRLSNRAINGQFKHNFVEDWSDEAVDRILREVAPDSIVALKTHAMPSPRILALADSGRARIQVTCRDPREVVLSLQDAGERARQRGAESFSEIETRDDAISCLADQLEALYQWTSAPDTLGLYYDQVAFDTASAIERIVAHLGLSRVSARRLEHEVKNIRFTQLNKGVYRRHLQEMDPGEAEAIRHRFEDYYETYCAEPAGEILRKMELGDLKETDPFTSAWRKAWHWAGSLDLFGNKR